MFINALKMRLGRLFQKSAWRNVNLAGAVLLLLIAVAMGISLIQDSADSLTWVVFIAVIITFAFYIIVSVCESIDYFTLANGAVKVFVFQNVRSGKKREYEILILKEDEEACFIAVDYKVPFRTPEARCFILRGDELDKRSWFVWSVDREEVTHLGVQLNRILFLPSGEGNGFRILAQDGSYEQLNGGYIVYDSLFVPKGSQFCYANREKNPQMPDKYLLTREKDIYKCYGFYLTGETPHCRELIISSIIFREGAERILLQYDEENKTYRDVFRCFDVSRTLNEYFIEMTENYNCGGNIYYYNGKTEKLEKVYTGSFRAVDFDKGLVLGADGNEYGAGSMYASV